MKRLLIGLLAVVLGVAVVACANRGLPSESGSYDVKPNSITFDGRDYSFYWLDQGRQLHRALGSDVKMVEDERTYLEMRGGEPILHLKADEPVVVQGRDRDGDFGSFWFPFLVGQAVGSLGRDRPVVVAPPPQPGETRQPTYRYPPTDAFGRNEEMRGSISNNKPSTPDYSRVQPAPNAVSGAAGGTGGGTAATNKRDAVSSSQSGGAGAGSAATNKGTFREAPSLAPAGGSRAPGKQISPASSRPPKLSSPGRSGGIRGRR
ncbi:MAG: hypothetical protein HYY04_09225 [Chloroflexi bacterium]|nr:hypothetical protein [Chloroflexota bacterium]